MLLDVIRKLASILKVILLVLVVLLVAPRIAAAALQMSCALPTLTTERVDHTEVISRLTEQIRTLEEYHCAEYRGTTFVDETVPVEFLGAPVNVIHLYRAVPGIITAGIDLGSFSEENVRLDQNILSVDLPGPEITGCQILYDEVVGGISTPRGLPLGSASDLAEVEDAMLERARMELTSQAVECGLLDRAREELHHQVRLLTYALGYRGQVQVSFAEWRRDADSDRESAQVPGHPGAGR